MSTGTVKWFNNAKGYGFILPEGGGDELFAHFSAITMEGYKTLKAGQQVEFDVAKGDKGYHAVGIKPVSKAGSAEEADLDQAASFDEAEAHAMPQQKTAMA